MKGPFGVGYGFVHSWSQDDGRRGFLNYMSCQREACKKRQMEEDEYVSLHAGRWSIMCMREG